MLIPNENNTNYIHKLKIFLLIFNSLSNQSKPIELQLKII